MEKEIKKQIKILNIRIQSNKKKIYENGNVKPDISNEYLTEKEKIIQEAESQLRNYEDLLEASPKMQNMLFNMAKYCTTLIIIVAYFKSGRKVIYRGCGIYFDRSKENFLHFTCDYGYATINIDEIETINFVPPSGYERNMVCELIETDGTLNKVSFDTEKITEGITEIASALSEISNNL